MNAKPKANPLQSIAQLVQKEFQEQSAERFIANTNILNKNSRQNKMGFSNTEIEIPDFPKTSSMESTRSIRKNETVNVNDSDDPSDWKDSKEETETLDPIESAGSIYTMMPDGTPGEEPMTNEEAALQLALAIRKGHEKGKPDIDWHLVKVLFVYGGWSYDRIASECNVSYSLVRLYGRKGRWLDARNSYRAEQAQAVAERMALEENRLRDWQVMKRRQAGIDGLAWFTKAISNLRDDASPESIAKLGGLLDRMLSSVTGLAPVEQPSGGSVNVRVENNVGSSQYAPDSPQAKLSAVWEKKLGENDQDHTLRIAFVIRDLYLECERAGLYSNMILDAESQRQVKLRNRLGIEEDDYMPANIVES